ncbi:MAG: hypothetical protein AAF602_09615 [Myxococcota bacterium]
MSLGSASIVGNHAGEQGGGLYTSASPSAAVGLEVRANTAGEGAGVYKVGAFEHHFAVERIFDNVDTAGSPSDIVPVPPSC